MSRIHTKKVNMRSDGCINLTVRILSQCTCIPYRVHTFNILQFYLSITSQQSWGNEAETEKVKFVHYEEPIIPNASIK